MPGWTQPAFPVCPSENTGIRLLGPSCAFLCLLVPSLTSIVGFAVADQEVDVQSLK